MFVILRMYVVVSGKVCNFTISFQFIVTHSCNINALKIVCELDKTYYILLDSD